MIDIRVESWSNIDPITFSDESALDMLADEMALVVMRTAIRTFT